MQHMVKRLVCLAYHMAAGHCAAVAMVCAVAGLGFGARAGVSSTGAEGLTVGGDTVLRFTSTAEGVNSFTLDEATEAWILCVGGGGGGSTGSYADLRAAGGGAGGMVEDPRVLLEPGTYSVEVGQGGAATKNGGPSTITLGEIELYKALGGGASPSWDAVGANGGSGGGGSLKKAGGAGITGQGHDGGAGGNSGGGGGGAGEPGHAGNSATDPGAGGAGRSSAITGSVVYYAGGGSGQRSTISASGGGGRGSGSKSLAGGNGTNGLGGGGGGGGNGIGGSGGSGVVVVRLTVLPGTAIILR